ncbi:MAG: hypothetical protein AB7T14_10110 [Candidatus Methylacidiphilaceae bacterium]
MTTDQTILDAEFVLAKKSYTASEHADAKDLLQKQFPEASWDDILDAYSRACELVRKCYGIGDQARREKIPDDEALQIMAKRFPGFSEKTYNYALTLGWFLSR